MRLRNKTYMYRTGTRTALFMSTGNFGLGMAGFDVTFGNPGLGEAEGNEPTSVRALGKPSARNERYGSERRKRALGEASGGNER